MVSHTDRQIPKQDILESEQAMESEESQNETDIIEQYEIGEFIYPNNEDEREMKVYEKICKLEIQIREQKFRYEETKSQILQKIIDRSQKDQKALLQSLQKVQQAVNKSFKQIQLLKILHYLNKMQPQMYELKSPKQMMKFALTISDQQARAMLEQI